MPKFAKTQHYITEDRKFLCKFIRRLKGDTGVTRNLVLLTSVGTPRIEHAAVYDDGFRCISLPKFPNIETNPQNVPAILVDWSLLPPQARFVARDSFGNSRWWWYRNRPIPGGLTFEPAQPYTFGDDLGRIKNPGNGTIVCLSSKIPWLESVVERPDTGDPTTTGSRVAEQPDLRSGEQI